MEEYDISDDDPFDMDKTLPEPWEGTESREMDVIERMEVTEKEDVLKRVEGTEKEDVMKVVEGTEKEDVMKGVEVTEKEDVMKEVEVTEMEDVMKEVEVREEDVMKEVEVPEKEDVIEEVEVTEEDMIERSEVTVGEDVIEGVEIVEKEDVMKVVEGTEKGGFVEGMELPEKDVMEITEKEDVMVEVEVREEDVLVEVEVTEKEDVMEVTEEETDKGDVIEGREVTEKEDVIKGVELTEEEHVIEEKEEGVKDGITAGIDMCDLKKNTSAFTYEENSCDSVVSNIYPDFSKFECNVLENGKPEDNHVVAESVGEGRVSEARQIITEGLNFVCLICDKQFKKKGGLSTHMKMHFNKGVKEYKKPYRLCPFCNTLQSRLPRHIESQHADVPDVAAALILPKHSEERNLAFAQLRKDGIYKYNKEQAGSEQPLYMSERSNQSDLVSCSKCKGFYGRRFFHRHKEICIQDSSVLPKALHLETLPLPDNEFSQVVLSRFQNDDVGSLCRTDPILRMIGKRLFQKNIRKVDKTMEVRKSVMSDMRLLARLFLAFAEICPAAETGEMFCRKNFSALEQAVDVVTKPDGILKYGVKNTLFYLLKSSISFIVAHYLSLGDDIKAAETKKMAKLLEMNRDVLFGDSVYAINLSRQEKLRMPEQQANSEDLSRLSKFIADKIKETSSEFTFIGVHEYVELRDSTCARLTLFNARRGGEPSRLKIKQLQDAWDKRWVDEKALQNLEEWEQKLFADLHIAYQPGKGNHLVPVLIPTDLVVPLKRLADPELRKKVDVLDDNIYVFPMTGQTMNHVHGWASINKMCRLANCNNPELLTASKQRHRISTLYCALDIPDNDRDYFYKHMGHSKAVNVGTYQYPLPIMEVTKVGKHLQQIDRASYTKSEELELRPRPSQSVSVESPSPIDSEDETSDQEEEEEKHYVHQAKATGKRNYFRWSSEETRKVNQYFHTWISIREGNPLPSKKDLEEYMETSNIGCTYKQLRTKVMNEQNKRQALLKKRCSQMNIKEI